MCATVATVCPTGLLFALSVRLHSPTGRRAWEEDYCILDNGANQLTSAAPVFRSGVSNSSLMTEGA